MAMHKKLEDSEKHSKLKLAYDQAIQSKVALQALRVRLDSYRKTPWMIGNFLRDWKMNFPDGDKIQEVS